MSEQTNPIRDAIAEAISENDVILFMKGTPDGPACGFSARAVAALQAVGTPFAAVDILPDPRFRQELSMLSGWPTIPQLFVGGELVGGSDIIIEMYESGELAEAVGAELPEGGEEPAPLEPQQAEPAPPTSAARPASPASRPLPIENRLN